jgi:AcrR family transcriptional regulator
VKEIGDVAWRLLADEGEDALTMRRIADELGVSAPSLYKHIDSKDAIVALIQGRALAEGADAMRRALAKNPHRPRLAAALAYRRWALKHRAQYRVATDRPLLRDRLPDGLEARAAQPTIDLADGDGTLARLMWATAHGIIALELAGRFPPDADLDALWELAFG